jgi:hypothetical protein
MSKNKQPTTPAADRYDVYVVDEYKDKAGEEKSNWTRVGTAWPHKDGKGFNAELCALPVTGKLVMRIHEPKPEG